MSINNFYNERELFASVAKADKGAFTVLYNRMYPALFHLAFKLLDNNAEAEDIVADTFIKFWKAREQFTTMAETTVWLRRTAKNATLDVLKHRRVKRQKAGEVAEYAYPPDQYMAADVYTELLQEIYDQIEQLPPKGKEIFKLRYIDGLSNDEIAARLGINNQSVRDHVARSLKTLRMEMLKKGNFLFFFMF